MRIAAIDTESTDLSASWGRILCASFLPIRDPVTLDAPYTFRADRKPWRGRDVIDDSKLVAAISAEINKYELIVTWNGKLHDIPLLNARLAKAGLPPTDPHMHLDLMWRAGGNGLKIGSKRLENVQRFFGLSEAKTPLDGVEWQRAAAGDHKALDRIAEHCEQDVKVLTLAYWRMIRLVRSISR